MGLSETRSRRDKGFAKPLKELLCREDQIVTVDTENDDHLEILSAIEEAILIFHESHPEITDSDVLITLEQMVRFLTRDELRVKDSLATAIDAKLRIMLSYTDYSFRDVKRFLNYILRSVEQHRKLAGPRAYLNFIKEQYADDDTGIEISNS